MPASDRPFRSHVDLILDRAGADPDRTVLSDARRRLTAAQFRRGIRNAALDLLARGIAPGSIIGFAAPVSVEAVLTRYAAGLLGCATSVCPHASDTAQLIEFLAEIDAADLVCFAGTKAVADAVRADGWPGRVHLVADVDVDVDVDVDAGVAVEPGRGGPALAGRPADPDALAVLATSGGTTGAAKASRRSYAGWLRAARGPADTNRRQLICTPLPYVAELLLDQTLLGGGVVILQDGWDPAAVLATIEAEQITHVCLVEPLLAELADHPEVARRDLSSLVAISHIGADAAASLRVRLVDRLGPVLAHPYGASDAGLVSMLGPADYLADARSGRASAGRVLPGVDVRIVADDGSLAAEGADGAIEVRSPSVAADFAGGRNRHAFRADGWYAIGDHGSLDSDGTLHILGRAADMRSIAGRATYPVEVQDALCAVPEVAYAVALPAPEGFEAVVVPLVAAAVAERDLMAAVPAELGLVRVVIAERVPVTEQGKPDRAALRTLLDGDPVPLP